MSIQGHKTDVHLPVWLSRDTEYGLRVAGNSRISPAGKNRERFLDRTLFRIVSFVEDSVFNETLSSKSGLLQMIEPRLKIITLLFLIIVLSFQKSAGGILLFLLLSVFMARASKITISLFLIKLLPAAVLTALISAPAALNLIVDGEPLFVFHEFKEQFSLGPFIVPKEIAVTKQGLNSAATLCLRVITSVSLVFLMTMTTRPNTFIKSLTVLAPKAFRPIISISYRYTFLLLKKIELFIMGFKSRNIAATNSARGRKWIASRIGLLFSISIEVSRELGMAMESRGCRETGVRGQTSGIRVKDFSKIDIAWFISVMLFAGVMLWKSIV